MDFLKRWWDKNWITVCTVLFHTIFWTGLALIIAKVWSFQ